MKSLQILNKITNLTKSLDSCPKTAFLQLANVKIPQICAETFKIPLVAFEKIDVGTIESSNPLMAEILQINNKTTLEKFLQNFKHCLPKTLEIELERLYYLASNISYTHCLISPLYYAPMSYYKGLSFRFFTENVTLVLGGEYEILEQQACGFGIYTDNLIQYIKE